jgi:hypothetical protein
VAAGSAAVLTVSVAYWALAGDQTRNVGAFLASFGLAFAAYVVALSASRSLGRGAVLGLVALSVAWRVPLAVGPLLLSDDVNRYVWEGRVQGHGGNPYAWEDRPEAARWEPLRDRVWAAVSHKDYVALYPPAWQLVARAVVAVHDSVTAMKAFLVVCELATLAALWRILERRGLPPSRILVAAWSPLALVEIAGSGHNDAFGILALVVALAALEAGRPLLGAVASAVAFQAKLLPGLVAIAWARRFRWWHALAAMAVAAALVVPYLDAGSGLWFSAVRYARYWQFNDTAHGGLRALFGVDAAAVASVAGVAGVALAAAWRRAEPAAAGLAVVAASLVLAANVLPWYALWLLPFLVLRDEPAALLFTGTVALAYLVYPAWRSGEPWQVPWALRALEYGPCVALAAWSRRR